MGVDPITLSAIIGAVAAVGTTAATVATQKKPEMPQLPKPTTDVEATEEVRGAEEARRRALAANRGQSSTILTSPFGSEEQNPTPKATLLGV